jgi:hypothetical protein
MRLPVKGDTRFDVVCSAGDIDRGGAAGGDAWENQVTRGYRQDCKAAIRSPSPPGCVNVVGSLRPRPRA